MKPLSRYAAKNEVKWLRHLIASNYGVSEVSLRDGFARWIERNGYRFDKTEQLNAELSWLKEYERHIADRVPYPEAKTKSRKAMLLAAATLGTRYET